MAIRLQSEFRSLSDDQFRIKIIDSAFTGTATDVNVGGDGFTLTHDGETDTLFSPIIGSSVSLTIYNNDSAIDTFRTALLNAQEKQFSIRIERWKKPKSIDYELNFRNRVLGDGGVYESGDCVQTALVELGVGSESRSDIWQTYFNERVTSDGGVTEDGNCVSDGIDALGGTKTIPDEEFELFWTGFITQDLIEEVDESKPRAITLNANDGISLLSNVDFEFTLASATTKSFVDALVEMLSDAGISDLYESTDVMLTSVVNWYAEELTYNIATDPLDRTFVDWRAFTNYEQGGGRTFERSLDVIREMCVTFGARFYQSGGSYRFEQIGARDDINVREFRYLNDGTLNDYETTQLDVVVDQTSTYRRGGSFRYLPAVKEVSLTLNKKSATNIIGGAVRYDSAFGDELDIGVIPSADNARVLLTMRGEIQTYIATPTLGVATPIFAVTIRLEPTDGTANQYWTNTIVSGQTSFSVGAWGTTLGTYKWAGTNVSRQTSSTTAAVHQMATGPLPKDGELFIDITILGLYDSTGSSTSFFIGGNSYAWAVDLQSARYENGNDPANVVEAIYKATNTNPNLGSRLKLSAGQTRMGDGVGAVGSLYVDNGSGNVASTGWREGDSGTYVDISRLVVRDVLSLQNKVVNRFEGGIIDGGLFHNRFRFDSAYWLPLRSTFVANNDELEIEVFKNARYISFTDINGDPVDVVDFSSGANVGIDDFSGTYVNASNGVLGGMVVDSVAKTLGPFKETAAGKAQITEDVSFDGAAAGPSLQLTGGSGAQGLMQWDGDEDTIALTMNGTQHLLGQDMVYNVKNQSGAAIDKGTPVMASGALGSSGRITIVRAEADGSVSSKYFIGVTAENIDNGADGKVIEFGKIRGLNTSAYSDGDVLWLDPTTPGSFTATEPSAPNLKIPTAIVINAHDTQGVILVRATQGYRLADLHDVNITSPAEGDILRWDNDLKYWYNTPFPG